MEWLALKSRLPRGVTASEAGELATLRAAAAGRSAPTADARGFRQAAVLLTRGGALAALHSGDGRPLWRAPGVAPAGVRATLLRAPSPSDAATHTPTLAIVWRGGYTLVDAHTGAVTEEGGHPLHAGALVPLPGSSAYLLIGDVPTCASCGGDGPRVAVWPPTAAARARPPTLPPRPHRCAFGWQTRTQAPWPATWWTGRRRKAPSPPPA